MIKTVNCMSLKDSNMHHYSAIKDSELIKVKALYNGVKDFCERVIGYGVDADPDTVKFLDNEITRLKNILNIFDEKNMRGINIKASHWHDAGAYGKCSYCGRYSDNRACLNDGYKCECGKKNGFSGSFLPPDSDSKWESQPEDEVSE